MRKEFGYNLISKYRAVIMGAAIIMIMFCHLDIAQEHNGVSITSLAGYLHLFTVGVDIFLLVSGLGLYYSYTKKPLPYFRFEKKRIVRILPWYLVIAGITYFVYDILISHLGFLRFIQDYTFISWVRFNKTRYWYVLAIIVFYLVFPLVYRMVNNKRFNALWLIVFVAGWFIISEILCRNVSKVGIFKIALERFPIFVVGTYLGKLSYEKKSLKGWLVLPFLLIGPVAFLASTYIFSDNIASYLYYPIRGLLAISIIIAIIIVMNFADKKLPKIADVLTKILGWFGGLTLELYLLHQSYMILFEYPCNLLYYTAVAFALPTVTALIIWLCRKGIKQRKAKNEVL